MPGTPGGAPMMSCPGTPAHTRSFNDGGEGQINCRSRNHEITIRAEPRMNTIRFFCCMGDRKPKQNLEVSKREPGNMLSGRREKMKTGWRRAFGLSSLSARREADPLENSPSRESHRSYEPWSRCRTRRGGSE